MSDAIVRAMLQDSNLKISVAVLTDTAREARRRHGLKVASASLFAPAGRGSRLPTLPMSSPW